jgi:hypothetical protein
VTLAVLAGTLAMYTIAGPEQVAPGTASTATVVSPRRAPTPSPRPAGSGQSRSRSAMIDPSVLVSIAAVCAAAASAFYAGRALREARKANAVPALLDFVRECRQYEPDRRSVLRHLRDEHDPRLGISGLPDEAREHVIRVCHYLDQLGILVDQRIVDPEAVAGFMGESILVSWRALAPYIKGERAARKRDYVSYFEDLAAQVFALGLVQCAGGYKRFPPTPSCQAPSCPRFRRLPTPSRPARLTTVESAWSRASLPGPTYRISPTRPAAIVARSCIGPTDSLRNRYEESLSICLRDRRSRRVSTESNGFNHAFSERGVSVSVIPELIARSPDWTLAGELPTFPQQLLLSALTCTVQDAS